MASLRCVRAVAATAVLVLVTAAGARAGTSETETPWGRALLSRLRFESALAPVHAKPLAGPQIAQAEPSGDGSTSGLTQLPTQTSAGLEDMPRPMSPLLRLPPREAIGDVVDTEDDELLPYIGPERGETVLTRDRPELEPMGVRVGSFLVLPSITGAEEFNSNIFATPDEEVSDFITHVLPSLIIDSDWAVHRLTFRADADIGVYADNEDENFQDYRVGAAGRLDISSMSHFALGADFKHLHEARDSPDDVGGAEPTEFNDIAATAEFYQEFGRFRARVLGTFDDLNFDDVPGAGGDINNDDRDRYETEGTVRLGYELVPEYEAYAQGSYNVRNYDAATDDNGFDRDSNGFSGDVGIEVDFGGITFGDFFIGYRAQYYDDPEFETIDGLDAGAHLVWNVTPLTTVTGTLRRSIGETVSEDSSGFIGTEFDLTVDHELLRNLILGAEARYVNRDYEGIDRIDDVYEAGINANYMLNRNVYLGGGYEYHSRHSTFAEEEYDQHVATIHLTLQY
jgi:hypothetical protein